MDHKAEAFALSGFMLTVNLMRLLAFKGVISPDEALATVDEARRQLRGRSATNQAARADMLDRELLDYEALFREVDDRAAEDLMATLSETLERILETDQHAQEEDDIGDIDIHAPWHDAVHEPWQPDGWGEDIAAAEVPPAPPRWANEDAEPAIEISEYEDSEEEPANQR